MAATSSVDTRVDAGWAPTMPARAVLAAKAGVAVRAAKDEPNDAASVASDGVAEAAGTVSVDRVVGRTPIYPRPMTPSPGSRGGYRRVGSPMST